MQAGIDTAEEADELVALESAEHGGEGVDETDDAEWKWGIGKERSSWRAEESRGCETACT